MKRVVFAAAGVALLGLVQAAGAAPKGPARVAVPAQAIVEGRHAAMMMSGSALGALKAQLKADDLKRAASPARALAVWAKAIPGMFPQGSNVAPTEALPAVWSDRAGFAAAAQEFVIATTSLTQAVAANDMPTYAANLERVGKACSACHDKYRKPDEHHH